ncbi:MipA/OmpV family protein [Sulfurimonas sp.]|uniref:MipA/OmpV family protein n=1 Tax=Sulfurimonas sp. TaxID=2022749 RepID=UPI00260CB9A9|nr:MipA/OmpV family protein [Sulfurimonas sp.]
MKYLLILSLFFFTLNAADAKQKVTIGLGPYIQTQPYKDVSPLLVPSPVIFFDNSLFYIRWSRFGMYFLGKKEKEYAWGFSITAQPRTYGYKANDSKTLKGMDERKTSFEAGLAFSASYHKKHIETMLLTDMLGRYNSWIFKTEIGDEYHLNKLSFYPSLIVIYQSQKFLDYYYGVKESEKIDGIRPAYTPSDGVLFGAQTYISYPLTKKLSTLINIRADLIPQTAYNSPIVNDRFIYSGLLSLIYTFEY